MYRVVEDVDLNFRYGRADNGQADVETSEDHSGPGRCKRKETTQHTFDNVDVGTATIHCTVMVALSSLDKWHKNENCMPRAAHRSAGLAHPTEPCRAV